MARKTKDQKRIENAVEAAFKQHGQNIQFDIMDLGKISSAGEEAGQKGQDIDEAVKTAIAQFRKN